MLVRAVRYAEGQEPLNACLGRQIPVVEHRRRGAVLLGCCAQPAAARRNGAGATFVFIARRFSNWGWLRIDRLQPPSVADPQAACGATTDGAADPADGGADPPAPRPALPAMAPINAPRGALSRFRERPGCYDIAWWRPIAWRGRGITPRWVIIAHINHRLTPALRHGSSLLHQARERSEPFLDRLMAERHPGYMAAAREWQSAVLDNRDRQTRRSRLRGSPPSLGGRTYPRLAQSQPSAGQRL